MTGTKAHELRRHIEQAAVSLSDTDALEAVELFPAWRADEIYAVGDRVRWYGTLYRCLTAHTSQDAWVPEAAPSLWAQVLIPDPTVIPDWIQPDSTNAYKIGDKVRYDNKIWISDVDNNVWTPGVFGWDEVTE